MSRVNAPFVPTPLQANLNLPAAPADVKPGPGQPRTLGGVAVWIVLIVGLLIVADLLVARAGHVWTATTIGLLACIFLGFLVTTRQPAGVAPPPKDDSTTEKPSQA
jgi:hypothetical protein